MRNKIIRIRIIVRQFCRNLLAGIRSQAANPKTTVPDMEHLKNKRNYFYSKKA